MLTSIRYCNIHLRAISQEISQPSITEISKKINYLKLFIQIPQGTMGMNGVRNNVWVWSAWWFFFHNKLPISLVLKVTETYCFEFIRNFKFQNPLAWLFYLPYMSGTIAILDISVQKIKNPRHSFHSSIYFSPLTNNLSSQSDTGAKSSRNFISKYSPLSRHINIKQQPWIQQLQGILYLPFVYIRDTLVYNNISEM